jgi:hypothetical protein
MMPMESSARCIPLTAFQTPNSKSSALHIPDAAREKLVTRHWPLPIRWMLNVECSMFPHSAFTIPVGAPPEGAAVSIPDPCLLVSIRG